MDRETMHKDMYNYNSSNNKNKSTGKTVTIVFLIILLLLAISYIGYGEYQKTLTNNEKAEDVERTELYYSEVNELLNQIDMYNYAFKSVYPIEDINDIDNQLKLQFGIYALKTTEKINNYYKEEDMDEMYNNYFTSDFNVIYENIKCPSNDGNDIYILNSDSKTYEFNDEHAHGGISMDVDTFYVSGKIVGNKYIVRTNILYSNYCNDTCVPVTGYFKSYSDAVKGEQPVMQNRSEYKDVSDELPVTTFTFIKEKNHYKLKSIEEE